MGLNLNLCWMLGVPEDVVCPRCRRPSPSYFNDYDIQWGDPNPNPGEWRLRCWCDACDEGWGYDFTAQRVRAPTTRGPLMQEVKQHHSRERRKKHRGQREPGEKRRTIKTLPIGGPVPYRKT